MEARQEVKSVQIDAVVIRADGRREDLGTIAHSSRWWNRFAKPLADMRIRRANRRING